ncbi:hypothetical protein AMAG_05708 [Allomyces macrogynus ATCC 38327]|uniref:Uncharacterized protein n=1 Tax=Allomyces macrogynus (strain ATCC 38327) TaxID=578462 RepID=A0A0L0SD31_ALLM3|nr:hypothetical protein AMAG_05708 [Allomyces macrogynus ATCC 38327]|eukprot:KNE60305.1 hypothetical protein AMAG_05708 [Allomyces macrogynus ATCC 38327]
MLGARAQSPAAASALWSRLDRLPSVILTHIAEWIHRVDSNGDTLLYLALAAPALYAPCLRVAIQICTAFESGLLRFAKPDSLKGDCDVQVGEFATAKTRRNEPVQWYFILPLRNRGRMIIPVNFSDNVTGISRTWTLLPVPIAHIRCFSIDMQATEYTAPPQCRRLILTGRSFPWTAITFPASLTELEMEDVSLPKTKAKMQRVFGQMPPNLRKLRLGSEVEGEYNEDSSASAAEFGKAVGWLFPLLHATITTLILTRCTLFPASALRALADLISRLALLSSFTFTGCVSTGLALVFRALPRTGMTHLELSLGITFEAIPGWAALASNLPTSVNSLRFVMTSSDGAYGALETLPAIERLTLATDALTVRLPIVTNAMCNQLPLAPTLRDLSLELEFKSRAQCLAAIIPRLPASLAHLTLKEWRLGRTPTIMSHLPAHLPPSIKALDLRGNQLSSALSSLPPHLRLLNLQDNFRAAQRVSFNWMTQVLPATMRWLDVTSAPAPGVAEALLAWPHSPRVTGQKMQVCMTETGLPDEVRQRLRERFDVVHSTTVPIF